jgi:hypothetical protein
MTHDLITVEDSLLFTFEIVRKSPHTSTGSRSQHLRMRHETMEGIASKNCTVNFVAPKQEC